jgi:AraC-like DNA-binding protein
MPLKDQSKNGRVPVAYLKLFLQHAEAEGFRPASLLSGTRLQPDELRASEAPVGFADTRRVLSNVSHAMGPGWHLSLASRLTIPSHGPLGFAVVTAPNVGAAVNVLLRFVGTRGPWVWLSGSEEGDEFVIRLHESLDMGDERAALVELTLLAIQNMIERPLGREIHGARIALAYPEPAYRDRLAGSFHPRLEFNAGGHLLSFPAGWLREKCILHDAAMHRYLVARCEEDLRLSMGVLPIEIAVRQALLASTRNLPGLREIAATQHVSSRTLIRRLRRAGTSYKAIREDVRKTLAADYLLNSELSVASIAFRLAYHDPSNFGRAFRSWFGISPGQYRARARTHREKPI